MNEELIQFETAKLAKEKGFDVELNQYYHIIKGDVRESVNGLCDYNRIGSTVYEHYYSRPTQSLLQRWIWENHSIWVVVEFLDTKGFYVSVYKIKGDRSRCLFTKYGKNPHRLKEKGLEEGLKLIK